MNETWKPTVEEVAKLLGPEELREHYSLAEKASNKLRDLLKESDYVHALGAVTGNQAMQMVKAGLPAIYCSGWQVAADANGSHHMYPDQSLYTHDSVPMLVRKMNNCFKRSAQIEWADNSSDTAKWLCPIIADMEAGFGGALNVFELTKLMIEAGAAGIHLEDQLSSAKKCGHLGGKVLVPASEHIKKLKAARLAAEVCGVNIVIIARTDANSAKLLTSNIDNTDAQFLTFKDGKAIAQHHNGLIDNFLALGYSKNGAVKTLSSGHRTSEGFYRITGGIDMAIERGLQYAPYCDMIWCETSTPDLEEAKKFADGIHAKFPDKMLAYNCSPSFNWKDKLDEDTISQFQTKLGEMGYKFQFVTLAGFHTLNYHMFDLAKAYQEEDMAAYARLQSWEFDSEMEGYTAHKHQREVGTGYFDLVAQTVDEQSSTTAMKDSTEKDQF